MADRIKNYQQEADQITTLKEIRTDLGVTPSSYTPDATVVTKDRVVTFAQAEEELVVLSDIEKGVKQQIVDVDIAQKDISNIKALLQGNLYDYQTDSTSAYTKSVPSGAMPYAGIEQIGGKTIVWNQLTNPANFYGAQTKSGVTYTPSSDGSVSFTNEATGNAYFDIYNYSVITNHKYLVKGLPTGVSGDEYYMQNAGFTKLLQSESDFLFTYTGSANTLSLKREVTSGTTYNETVYPQFIDLTLAFGSGNEPTLEQCKEMFPADYYEYNAGELLSAGVTEVDSYGYNHVNESYLQSQWTYADGVYYGNVNMFYDNYNNTIDQTYKPNTAYTASCDVKPVGGNMQIRWQVSYTDGTVSESSYYSDTTKFGTISITTDPTKTINYIKFGAFNGGNIYAKNIIVREANPLQTISIPTAIRNLEGYGWSAGSVSNYIDFERKVFVQNLAKLEINSNNFSFTNSMVFSNNTRYQGTISTAQTFKDYPNNGISIPIAYDNACAGSGSDIGAMTNDGCCVNYIGSALQLWFVSLPSQSNVTSVAEANTWLSTHPITIYIEIANPVETDISAYLTDDNLIQVESGGTLTFPNSNGTDYQIPVPSEETYMIDLQEAINNG